MLASPGVEVNQLHDKFYRKYPLYTMAWDKMDLSQHMVEGAPSGGPVALVKDPDQIHRAQGDTSVMIRIYTSAGSLISQVQWTHQSRLKKMGWSEKEELVCVA